MGTAYEGSLLQWIDQHGGATHSADQLFQMAQQEGKDWPYDKIRSARNVRRGVTIVLGPNGVPLRGHITKQQEARPKLGPGEKQRPGFFTNARAGAKPPEPPPLPKKLGRPPKAKAAPDAGPEVVGVVPRFAGKVSVPEAPSIDPRQGALDLGIRKPERHVAATKTAVAVPVPKVPRRAVRAQAQPEPEPESAELSEEALPPAKHTALRRLILDVGLDVARQIIDEFEDVSERIR